MTLKSTSIFLLTSICVVSAFSSANSAEFYPRDAGSWGGKVRAGPGTNFSQIDGLSERHPVTLLANAGNDMNGYPWFLIRFKNGREGYKWGGILCSFDQPIPGLAGHCIKGVKFTGDGGNTQQPQPINKTVTYTCNEGIPLRVTYVVNNTSNYVIYSHDSSPDLRLESAVSGSGSRYSDGYYEILSKGTEATLVEGGNVIDTCREDR